MRAVLLNAGGRFRFTTVDDPTPAAGEVLVRVRASGICASDLHLAAIKRPDELPFPILAGHEFAGEIVDLGRHAGERSGVLAVGDIVVVEPNVPCGVCPSCRAGRTNFCASGITIGLNRAGGFAELVAVPAPVVHRVRGIPAQEAALAEPLACALHAVERAAPPPGALALVYGAGAIGLMSAQVLLVSGARSVTVVDRSPERLATSLAVGAEWALPAGDRLAERLLAIAPEGFDVVVDATGVPEVVESAFDQVGPHGMLLFVGSCPTPTRISVAPRRIQRMEAVVLGSFGYTTEFPRALELLESGRVHAAPLVSQPFPLERVADVIAAATTGRHAVKVQFDPALVA